ncbi:MAG: integrase core domain-containing protein [Bacillota bacterium]
MWRNVLIKRTLQRTCLYGEKAKKRKATPYDNACVESFFASMKKEYLNKLVFKTKAEAIAAVQFYVEFYNRKRMHSTLGYATPMEYELAYEEASRQNANLKKTTSA